MKQELYASHGIVFALPSTPDWQHEKQRLHRLLGLLPANSKVPLLVVAEGNPELVHVVRSWIETDD